MTRYRIGPRAAGWVEDETFGSEPHCPDVTVDGPAEVDTGLITASGEPIYRVPPPIGFGRDGEW